MWQISADTGGTFTDLFALTPDGRERVFKLLSSGELRARVEGVTGKTSLKIDTSWPALTGFVDRDGRRVVAWNPKTRVISFDSATTLEPGDTLSLKTGEAAPVVGARILTGTAPGEVFPALEFRLATTRGTNALLERRGAEFAFFVTEGFEDLLAIGDQRRPDLFALDHEKRPPLHAQVAAVHERVTHDGTVLVPPDLDKVRTHAKKLVSAGITSAAIALVHSYRFPAHEKAVSQILRECGFTHISVSSDLAPLIKLLPRAQTACVDAYLAPVMETFISSILESLHPGAPLQLMTSAGGLLPAAEFRAKDGLLSGPAGGVVGAATAAKSAGHPRVLTLDMGGTSSDVARIDGGYSYQFSHEVGDALLLAPAMRIETVAAGGGSICSFGANGLSVGPASAGAHPGPACYGAGGPLTLTDVNLLLGRFDPSGVAIPIELAPAKARLAELASEVKMEEQDLLEGLLEIAVERMAAAIRKVSVLEGFDPAEYALLAFGGAGPQHACAVARKLGISTVLVPQTAGVLSAAGLSAAVTERIMERQILRPLDEGALATLSRELQAGLPPEATECRTIAEVRLEGQESPIAVDLPDVSQKFDAAFKSLFGYNPPEERGREVVSLRVVGSTPAPEVVPETFEPVSPGRQVVPSMTSTTVIEQGWTLECGSRGTLKLVSPGTTDVEAASGAVAEELFRSRFESLVDQMGAALKRTAVSTNVKEREDYSCALLDEDGNLAVNAPHIPVHLGALGQCVRRVAETLDLEPGDTVVTNHPAFGGSHLPDVTLVTPVFSSGSLVGYVANRAHHAEIGGITPGSMPPGASNLAEEGVVIPPSYLYRAGVPSYETIERLLLESPYPSRRPLDNLADLRAQAAANLGGAAALLDLTERYGHDVVRTHLGKLFERGRRALRGMPEVETSVTENLDDGTTIALAVRKPLTFDFTGTSPHHPANFNATPAIVRSALLYALRLWVREDLPMNEGMLADVRIVLPESFLNPRFDRDDPGRCPAVVAGNVETSQRLVDALVSALGLGAASQGTMNNVVFGDATFGHYETLGGGAGATSRAGGASALHVHMTNTAITDVEVIETRYPVRITEFSIRRGSGGDGRFPGGDGLVREYAFDAPLAVSLLTQRRTNGPAGAGNGHPGSAGKQTLLHPDRTITPLGSTARVEVSPGDRLRVETPGGGGFGDPS